MVFPWFSHGFPYGLSRYSMVHAFAMTRALDSCAPRVSMAISSLPGTERCKFRCKGWGHPLNGLYMVSIWIIYGSYMDNHDDIMISWWWGHIECFIPRWYMIQMVIWLVVTGTWILLFHIFGIIIPRWYMAMAQAIRVPNDPQKWSCLVGKPLILGVDNFEPYPYDPNGYDLLFTSVNCCN